MSTEHLQVRNLGWECPKCGRCYAPHVDRCDVCVTYTIYGNANYSIMLRQCGGCGRLYGGGNHVCEAGTAGTAGAP